jgi:ABC-type dipeptide/oligopeptide/nickel transport system ATPase component
MIKASYDGWNTKAYDDMLPQFIKTVKDRIVKKNDDYLVLCVGETGTGKSTLMLESMELYNPEIGVEFVGLNPKDHAQALKNAKDYKGDKFCSYDEANIQKRNSTTKYNKELIDVYMAIRGLKIFHWWNNPSLDIIDKFFIQEKINAVIYIQTKDVKFPRIYYMFTKDAILNIFDRNKGKLTLKILKKCAKEYSTYQGWFRDYKGKNWEAYTEKKNERMDTKVEDFFEKYVDKKKWNRAEISRELMVCKQTVTNKMFKLIEENKFIEGEDHILNGANNYLVLESGKEKLKNYTRTGQTTF